MSDTPKTEADFEQMLNEAFGRGSIHAELESSDYLSHHRKADEKMAAYLEWRDAKARELAAVTAERDAEVALLRELHGKACEIAAEHRERAEQPRTDAEWKAADRKKRINDLAARYAGEMAGVYLDAFWTEECGWRSLVLHSRALAAAVVEAEE